MQQAIALLQFRVRKNTIVLIKLYVSVLYSKPIMLS